MASVEKTAPISTGVVLFTDGGAKPNPGPSGYGIHGYLYTDEPSKRGTGLATQVLTNVGYFMKAEFNDASIVDEYKEPVRQVYPTQYIDGLNAISGQGTNNIAELSAMIEAIEFTIAQNVKEARIFSDSEYVVKGISKGLPNWRKTQWRRPDGEIIKNLELWQKLNDLLLSVDPSKLDLRIDWVKAHVGLLGNERADQLATVARNMSAKGHNFREFKLSPSDGYWKNEASKPALITHRRLYFTGNPSENVPGLYFIGDHGKEDDQYGKPISDTAFACVFLATPDAALEMLRKTHYSQDKMDGGFIYARLENAYTGDIWQHLNRYGEYALTNMRSWSHDLYAPDKSPITTEFRPAGMASRGFAAFAAMLDILQAYRDHREAYLYTDITDTFYNTELVQKKGKPDAIVKTLKPEFAVGVASAHTNALCPLEGGVATLPITLTLGVDTPDRNSLKRIETGQPKVTLVTWSESPVSYRVATVIESECGYGIWCAFYSNLRISPIHPTKPIEDKTATRT